MNTETPDTQTIAGSNIAEGASNFLQRIDGILPILSENAAKAEELRRIPDESMQALTQAGIFRAVKPRRWGGLEIDPATWFEAVVRVGTACPSSAWITGVVGGHSWHAAMFPEAAQQDLWGNGQECRIASSFAPTGKVERAAGGFRLTGRWKFLSGVDHSEWIVVGGIVPDDGNGTEFRNFLVPASDFTIDQDSWHVQGLQGSGSKDATVDCIVPEYRTQTIEQVYTGTEPGKTLNTAPIFQLPWLSMFAYAVAAPAIGAATGAIEAFLADNRGRSSALSGIVAAQNPAVQIRLAEAASIVKDARARIPATWGSFYATVTAGERVSDADRARCRFEGAYTISRCTDAALRIFEVSGGGVLHNNKPFQRFLRDLMGMRNHPFAIPETWAGLYAATLFGFPLNPPLNRGSMACLF